MDSTFQRMAFFFWTLWVNSVLLTSYFFLCMTNQHAITDKSTTHSDRRYRQPARDQRAGAERTYFYVHSKNMAPIFKSVVWWFDDHLMPRKVLLNMISKGLWLDQGSPFLKCVFFHMGNWALPVRGGRGVRACLDGSGHLYHSSALCMSYPCACAW